VDGKPMHHLPSARQENWDEGNRTQSSIFVIDYPDLIHKDEKSLQKIFQHRHILVLNTPQKEEPFSLASLAKLGRLDRVIEMQGKFSIINLILLLAYC
jgi:hypothetical protein